MNFLRRTRMGRSYFVFRYFLLFDDQYRQSEQNCVISYLGISYLRLFSTFEIGQGYFVFKYFIISYFTIILHSRSRWVLFLIQLYHNVILRSFSIVEARQCYIMSSYFRNYFTIIFLTWSRTLLFRMHTFYNKRLGRLPQNGTSKMR